MVENKNLVQRNPDLLRYMNKDIIWCRSGFDESMSSNPAEVFNNAMFYRMFQSQLIPAEQL